MFNFDEIHYNPEVIADSEILEFNKSESEIISRRYQIINDDDF